MLEKEIACSRGIGIGFLVLARIDASRAGACIELELPAESQVAGLDALLIGLCVADGPEQLDLPRRAVGAERLLLEDEPREAVLLARLVLERLIVGRLAVDRGVRKRRDRRRAEEDGWRGRPGSDARCLGRRSEMLIC